MPGRGIVRIGRLDTGDASKQRDFRPNADDEQHAELEEIPLEERDTACEFVLRIVKHWRGWQAEREARQRTQVRRCVGDGVTIQREEVEVVSGRNSDLTLPHDLSKNPSIRRSATHVGFVDRAVDDRFTMRCDHGPDVP